LNGLREESQRDGKAELFENLKVFLSREPSGGEYAAMARTAGTTSGAIGVAVHRLRHAYGQRVRAEVANTVAHPTEIEDELRYLFAMLTAG
jgi:RNA polymerase sigma-70 factor (ECF subfamily)